MHNTESGLNRLQNALKSKLFSGKKLLENRAKFYKKYDEVNKQLTDLELQLSELINDNYNIDAIALKERNDLVKKLKRNLHEIFNQINEVEVFGTEFIQTTGVGSKRRSTDLETLASNGETIAQITRQLLDLHKRYVRFFYLI